MRIITGDIGGTKTALELGELELEKKDGGLGYRTLSEQRFVSASYPSLEAIVSEFITGLPESLRGEVPRACFGIAGPVKDNHCRATNLPWVIDGANLARECGIGKVLLLNDFHTVVLGIELLGPDDYVALNDVPPQPKAPIAVLGAGTGLGEAFLFWGGQRYEAIPSEGGHCEFAPQGELQIDLLRYLTKKYGGHVSYERVCSGMGIGNIWEYVTQAEGAHGLPPVSAEVKAAIEAAPDRAGAIAEHAAKGEPLCRRTLEIFASIYGAEAGNLALKVMATGGVYLSGGIAPKLLDLLKSGIFMRAYGDKGRLSPLVASCPVRVILHKKLPILGAAVACARM